MSRRLVVLPALALLVAVVPGSSSAGGPAPQVIDAAGDANFLNSQGEAALLDPVVVPDNNATPVGSQAYADVVSVTWTPITVKKGKKQTFTGFTVTTTFSGPPTAPAGTTLVYRMLSHVKGDPDLFLGPVYYTAKAGETPQSALRDNLGSGNAVRLTPLALPAIKGSTMTWTVPVAALPREFTRGTAVTDMYFEVRELQSFAGQAVPAAVPVAGGSTGLAYGVVDTGSSTSSFKIG
jgi:hypothetical protein